MIQIVHFSDLHFGSGERYGKINSETGLNKRFEDFICALDKPVDFAIKKNVDLVIFTGDTYKHATPEPVYQREFAKRIKKLTSHKIPVVLLVGNHDILYRVDGSDVLDIYNTLEIEYVTVFNKIENKDINTKSGKVQLISLPHITKSRLLTKEEYRTISTKEQDRLMIGKVRHALGACLLKLDPDTPSVLIGHGTIETAKLSSEQDLSIGKVLSYPLSFFQLPELDYVGFGHIHKHQILQKEKPLILYAGSLERVDFGEEVEDKGFVYLEIKRGHVEYEFISSDPRKFLTIHCDLTSSINPQQEIEDEIKRHSINGAIVRVRYIIQEEKFNEVKQEKIKELLAECFSYNIQPEIVRKDRTYRISELDMNMVSNPLLALEKYLFDWSDNDKKVLLEKAKLLIQNL